MMGGTSELWLHPGIQMFLFLLVRNYNYYKLTYFDITYFQAIILKTPLHRKYMLEDA